GSSICLTMNSWRGITSTQRKLLVLFFLRNLATSFRSSEGGIWRKSWIVKKSGALVFLNCRDSTVSCNVSPRINTPRLLLKIIGVLSNQTWLRSTLALLPAASTRRTTSIFHAAISISHLVLLQP